MTNDTGDRDRLANFVASGVGIAPEAIIKVLEKATDGPAKLEPSRAYRTASNDPRRWFMNGLRSGIPQSGLAGLITVAIELTHRATSGRPLEGERLAQTRLAQRRAQTFAAVENYRAAQLAAAGSGAVLSTVPTLAFARGMSAPMRGRWLRPINKTEAPNIAQLLAESVRANVDAAVEAGDAIVEGGDLDDASVRQRMAGQVKRAGGKLSTAFWQAHGEVVLASPAPDSLKGLLKGFFAQVGKLKRRTGALANEPTITDLLGVVEDVTALIQIAIAIADEVRRIAAAA
jgi:hypothetical protein